MSPWKWLWPSIRRHVPVKTIFGNRMTFSFCYRIFQIRKLNHAFAGMVYQAGLAGKRNIVALLNEVCYIVFRKAKVAEVVDALDSKSSLAYPR